MASWLSWLERRPVTAEVVGSSPIWVVRNHFDSDFVYVVYFLPQKKMFLGS